jgi:hypothetical protein
MSRACLSMLSSMLAAPTTVKDTCLQTRFCPATVRQTFSQSNRGRMPARQRLGTEPSALVSSSKSSTQWQFSPDVLTSLGSSLRCLTARCWPFAPASPCAGKPTATCQDFEANRRTSWRLVTEGMSVQAYDEDEQDLFWCQVESRPLWFTFKGMSQARCRPHLATAQESMPLCWCVSRPCPPAAQSLQCISPACNLLCCAL